MTENDLYRSSIIIQFYDINVATFHWVKKCWTVWKEYIFCKKNIFLDLTQFWVIFPPLLRVCTHDAFTNQKFNLGTKSPNMHPYIILNVQLTWLTNFSLDLGKWKNLFFCLFHPSAILSIGLLAPDPKYFMLHGWNIQQWGWDLGHELTEMLPSPVACFVWFCEVNVRKLYYVLNFYGATNRGLFFELHRSFWGK